MPIYQRLYAHKQSLEAEKSEMGERLSASVLSDLCERIRWAIEHPETKRSDSEVKAVMEYQREVYSKRPKTNGYKYCVNLKGNYSIYIDTDCRREDQASQIENFYESLLDVQ
jgi:hypothetical protein